VDSQRLPLCANDYSTSRRLPYLPAA
jgi:hypothetical protein